ncbi:MAG: helix-turn-helix domain-containing protein [Armatimonadetes bacterium]|nr:helix-turn-helix domain-containing protein [Armatimonadota bacterium]
MAKIKGIDLNGDERAALEKVWREGKSHAFRQRCQMILLKAEQRASKDVAKQVGCCEVVVNTWLKRYREGGPDGLRTKAGQGRQAILKEETDLAAVRRAVQNIRQCVGLAKAELEQDRARRCRRSCASSTCRPVLDSLRSCRRELHSPYERLLLIA